jgi:DNA-directed RNA polymerase subunit RPC12/RpoP
VRKCNTSNTYCDDSCIRIVMKGVWTKTKAGGVFCQRHGMMINKCHNCGKEFHSDRVHTKTCSNRCRVALSRSRLKV